MRINKKYIIAFFILLVTEILIALCLNDSFIRLHFGDVLVIILIYTFIRGIIVRNIRFLPIYIFLFAIFVEVMRYIKIVELLNLENNKFISTIIGTSFDVKDIISYLIGSIILIIWESRSLLKKSISYINR